MRLEEKETTVACVFSPSHTSFHKKKILSLVMNLFSFLHGREKEKRVRWLGLLEKGGSLVQYPTSATKLKRKEKEARCPGAPSAV